MDSSVKLSPAAGGAGGGLKFISCFSYSDSLLIIKVLQEKFKLNAKMQPAGCYAAETLLPVNIYNEGLSSQYNIYIPKEYINDLKNKVSDFIIPEMKYKLLP